MKNPRPCLLVLVALWHVTLVGCIRSVNSFYTAADVVQESALEGDWVTQTAGREGTEPVRLTISKAGVGRSYEVTGQGPDNEGADGTAVERAGEQPKCNIYYRFVLFKVGRHFLIDIEHTDEGETCHYVYKLIANGHSLLTYPLDGDAVRSILKKNSDVLKHTVAEPDKPASPSGKRIGPFAGVTLTDTSENLARFLRQHADDIFAPSSFATFGPLVRVGGRKVPGGVGDGLFSRRQRTLDHWFVMRTIVRESAGEGADREGVVEHLRAAQRHLESLSSVGVDARLVQLRLDMVRFCTALDEYLWDERSVPEEVGRTLHHLGGKSFLCSPSYLPGGHDLRTTHEVLRRNVQQHLQQLGERYQVIFPTLGI